MESVLIHCRNDVMEYIEKVIENLILRIFLITHKIFTILGFDKSWHRQYY